MNGRFLHTSVNQHDTHLNEVVARQGKAWAQGELLPSCGALMASMKRLAAPSMLSSVVFPRWE